MPLLLQPLVERTQALILQRIRHSVPEEPHARHNNRQGRFGGGRRRHLRSNGIVVAAWEVVEQHEVHGQEAAALREVLLPERVEEELRLGVELQSEYDWRHRGGHEHREIDSSTSGYNSSYKPSGVTKKKVEKILDKQTDGNVWDGWL
jgi:hypothetical protein